MTTITKQQALNFLEKIEKKDKVGIITHHDLDGFASAILIYDYLKSKGCKIKVETYNYQEGVDKGITKNLKDCSKLIITDIAPFGVKTFSDLCEGKEVLNIDHHQKDMEIPSCVLEYRSEGYIPASRMAFELVGGKEWLALAGVLADMGQNYPENQEWINKFLKKLNLKMEDFNKSKVYNLIAFLIYFDKDLKKAFEILKEINSIAELDKIEEYSKPVEEEISRLKKEFKDKHEEIGKIIFYYLEPKFKTKSVLVTNLSALEPKNIYLFASPNQDGKRIDISVRNQSREYNLPVLFNEVIKGFEGASIGGHKAAAGGFFLKKDMEKFKENLKELGRKI